MTEISGKNVLIWLKKVNSVKNLPISKVENDLNQTCKIVLTKSY